MDLQHDFIHYKIVWIYKLKTAQTQVRNAYWTVLITYCSKHFIHIIMEISDATSSVCLSIFNITARILWTQNRKKMIHINKYKHRYKILFSVIDFIQKKSITRKRKYSILPFHILLSCNLSTLHLKFTFPNK